MTGKRKILFIDRDGTLIEEPDDYQVDRFDKLRLVPDVIPALRRLRDFGYEFVMVSNQDGLGTERFPREDFEGPHQLLIQIFESQGIQFIDQLIDSSLPEEASPNRKPEIGMVLRFLKSGRLDLPNCLVIGDRETDLQLAANMGIEGLQIGPELGWQEIADRIIDRPRSAIIRRRTSETDIVGRVELDRSSPVCVIQTGIGFFDHMLEQLVRHGGFSLMLNCRGDLQVDPHHTIEDVALAIGAGLDQSLGDRRGIGRYGFLLAMDESRANVAIDLSGRPVYVQEGQFTTDRIGEFPTEMVSHFFQSLSQSLRAAIHIEFRGDNNHHMCEAIFKGVGRALRPALTRIGNELPSTKGVL